MRHPSWTGCTLVKVLSMMQHQLCCSMQSKTLILELSSLKFLQFIGDFLYLFRASTFLGVATGLLRGYVINKLCVGRHSTHPEVAIMMLMAYLSYIMAEVSTLLLLGTYYPASLGATK